MTTQNKHLARFEPFLGTWTTEGKHPALPGRVLRGRVSFERVDGGAFVRMGSTSAEPEVPSGITYFGTDDGEPEGTMIYFDERGVSRRYTFTVRDGELAWHRDDPAFRQTFTIKVHADGQRLSGKGQMSRNGGPWEGDLDVEYTRIAPAAR